LRHVRAGLDGQPKLAQLSTEAPKRVGKNARFMKLPLHTPEEIFA